MKKHRINKKILKNQKLFEFLLSSGFRVDEILNLKFDEINIKTLQQRQQIKK